MEGEFKAMGASEEERLRQGQEKLAKTLGETEGVLVGRGSMAHEQLIVLCGQL